MAVEQIKIDGEVYFFGVGRNGSWITPGYGTQVEAIAAVELLESGEDAPKGVDIEFLLNMCGSDGDQLAELWNDTGYCKGELRQALCEIETAELCNDFESFADKLEVAIDTLRNALDHLQEVAEKASRVS
jgi:hypothetical protein